MTVLVCSDTPGVPDPCPECGDPLGHAPADCWECGGYRGAGDGPIEGYFCSQECADSYEARAGKLPLDA